MARGEFIGEGDVRASKSCQVGAGTGGGRCKIADVIDSLLLVSVVQGKFLDVLGGLESGSGSGNLGLAPLIVGRSEICFEGGPCFEIRFKALPNFEMFNKYTGLTNELEGNRNNLIKSVRSISRRSVIHRVFNLIK